MRSIGLAAAVAVAVLGIGWTLQSRGLPSATPARIAAARAVRWFERYRYATSTLTLGGRAVEGRCLHGWFEGRRDRMLHGTELVLADGLAVESYGRHLVVVGRHRLPPLAALELGGCTSIIGQALGTLAVNAHTATLRRSRIGGELALRMGHLTVLVAPRTDRPLGVELRGMKSSVRLVRLTPPRRRMFDDRL